MILKKRNIVFRLPELFYQLTSRRVITKKNVWIWVLLPLAVFLTSSCSTSKKSKGRDYTVNQKRSQRPSSRTYAHKKRSGSTKTRKAPSETKSSANEVRSRLVGHARSLKGAKYTFGGKSKASGFDCSGFICYVYLQEDITLPPGSRTQALLGRKIPLSSAQPGDLLFFGNSNGINHVAMVSDTRGKTFKIIHSTSSGGVLEEDYFESNYWKKKYKFARSMASELDPKSVATNK